MQKSFTWTDLSCPHLLRRSDQRVVQAGSSQSIFTDWRSSKDNIMPSTSEFYQLDIVDPHEAADRFSISPDKSPSTLPCESRDFGLERSELTL